MAEADKDNLANLLSSMAQGEIGHEEASSSASGMHVVDMGQTPAPPAPTTPQRPAPPQAARPAPPKPPTAPVARITRPAAAPARPASAPAAKVIARPPAPAPARPAVPQAAALPPRPRPATPMAPMPTPSPMPAAAPVAPAPPLARPARPASPVAPAPAAPQAPARFCLTCGTPISSDATQCATCLLAAAQQQAAPVYETPPQVAPTEPSEPDSPERQAQLEAEAAALSQVVETDDVGIAAPLPPRATAAKGTYVAPVRVSFYRSLEFRRTTIPVMLTFAFIALVFIGIGQTGDEFSIFSKFRQPAIMTILAIAAGVSVLGAVMAMLGVRKEMAEKAARAAGSSAR